MESGELVEGYKDMMRVNRPIPWIGMPVCFCGTWRLVIDEMSGQYVKLDDHTHHLETYQSGEPGKGVGFFCLPGEPDAEPMGSRFIRELLGAYSWGDAYRYEAGIWKKVPRPSDDAELHTALMLPSGADPSAVFVKQNAAPARDLKQLNTDGRTSCAGCSGPLKALWMGNTNLSHCPKCEP